MFLRLSTIGVGRIYEYKCIVRRIIDGDTFECDIDLGFSTVLQKEKVRLLGIDTPELRAKDLVEKQRTQDAKTFVKNLLPPGTEVIIRTHKDSTGKYGRYLANVFLRDEANNEVSLAKLLREHGFQK